ncbi:MAG TPA: YheC/YheD family protein, partial [Bacillota bacterium]|nr:YheC/YheD family protein [Bacillota bacterium]
VGSMGLIDEYLIKYKKIIVKPSMGAQGLGIYQISGDYDKYLIRDNSKKHKADRHRLKKMVDDFIKKGYLVQPYMECRTSMDEPFDFRIHIQKDGQGAWQITRMYARIGARGSILSNISQGGLACQADYFLKVEYKDRASYWKDKLETLSFDIAKHIEEIYMQRFDELGIDLAIDKNDNLWLYEVNSGPQTKYHEPERARNIIAYAKHIANNLKGKSQDVLLYLGETIISGIDTIKEKLSNDDKPLYSTVQNMMDTMECFGILEQRLKSTVPDYERSATCTLSKGVKDQFAKLVIAYEKNKKAEAAKIISYLSEPVLKEWMKGLKEI